MMSQIGSCARGTPSALDKARSAATGTVRSAILTYFGQIVIQEAAAAKRSYPRTAPNRLHPRPARALMVGAKHTGCRPATQKYKDEMTWQRNLMTALRG